MENRVVGVTAAAYALLYERKKARRKYRNDFRFGGKTFFAKESMSQTREQGTTKTTTTTTTMSFPFPSLEKINTKSN